MSKKLKRTARLDFLLYPHERERVQRLQLPHENISDTARALIEIGAKWREKNRSK